MNKIPNRQVICDVLMEHAKTDRDIVVLCSDSRGSASMTPFTEGSLVIFLIGISHLRKAIRNSLWRLELRNRI